MKIITLSWALWMLLPTALRAAESCGPALIPAAGDYGFARESIMDVASVTADTRVGELLFTRLPIFDEANPDEDNALFRWANRFHILTRERTVSQQLLFSSGEQFDQRLLQESARLLRRMGFFYDAAIRPRRVCGDVVDVEIITKDNWSFTPNLSFDRSGGENTWSVGLRESNLLGLGKELGIASSRDRDRSSKELIYEDVNVAGGRIRNRTIITDSDDGFSRQFRLHLPFFSLDSRRAWRIELEHEERQDEQFFRGDDVSEVEHEIEDYVLEYGVSDGLQNARVHRWSIGYRYREDSFDLSDELPPPAQFPIDRTLSYPFLKFERVEDNFITAFNLDQLYRTEDLHRGMAFTNRMGYAADAFGSDQERLVLDGFLGDTLLYDGTRLWQHSLEWEALWNLDSERAEDLLLSYETRYFQRQSESRALFASLRAVYSKNLNSHRQVVMGGVDGARAFDNRFQVGDRSVVFTLEQRLYTDIHLWNLVRLGGAVFADVGRAWEPGQDSGMEDDYLADIGFGLRLASSKAASDRIAHIDIAFPLSNRGDRDVNDVQIAFNIKGTF